MATRIPSFKRTKQKKRNEKIVCSTRVTRNDGLDLMYFPVSKTVFNLSLLLSIVFLFIFQWLHFDISNKNLFEGWWCTKNWSHLIPLAFLFFLFIFLRYLSGYGVKHKPYTRLMRYMRNVKIENGLLRPVLATISYCVLYVKIWFIYSLFYMKCTKNNRNKTIVFFVLFS